MKKVSSILVSLVAMIAMLPMTVLAAEDESQPSVIIDNGTGYVKSSLDTDSTILSQGNLTIIIIIALIAIAAIIVLIARKKK